MTRISFRYVSNSIRINSKHSLGFRKAGRVINFANSRLALSFPKVQSRGGRVSHNMTADGFFSVRLEHTPAVDLSHHLVRYHHGDSVLKQFERSNLRVINSKMWKNDRIRNQLKITPLNEIRIYESNRMPSHLIR